MAASRPLAIYHQRGFWIAGPLLHILDTYFSPFREQCILSRHGVWCNWQLLMLCISIKDNLSQLRADLAGQPGAGLRYPERGAGLHVFSSGCFQPFLYPSLVSAAQQVGAAAVCWPVGLGVVTHLAPFPHWTPHLGDEAPKRAHKGGGLGSCERRGSKLHAQRLLLRKVWSHFDTYSTAPWKFVLQVMISTFRNIW